MLYGLYLSASGVIGSSHKQDVIANNLANSETNGFRRDVPLFQERLTEAQSNRARFGQTNGLLEGLGGGFFASPSRIDTMAGDFEPTGSNLDVAIEGPGYFAVDDNGTQRLTRNGAFRIEEQHLVLSDGSGRQVLDSQHRPIVLDGNLSHQTEIAEDGQITQAGQAVGRLGLFDVPDPTLLTKQGGTLLNYPNANKLAPSSSGQFRSEFIERANVDPTTELANLMEAQRELEANANMIRYQDQTLSKLVNEVGRIS
ncbi:MAG: flagellar hook-basal body protein [Chthoniobacterales bacterium]|nr:flagellar hook-basal body protein [Chthoniobacterales bacterium]